MSIDKAANDVATTIEQALIGGDLSRLDPEQRVNYYFKVCGSLGLNPYTKPFEYLVLNGKLVLYARKDATDQLRGLRKVSIVSLERERLGELIVVTANARTPDGRSDSSIGAVNVEGLKGDALANAMMRAETKAKRRVTLSLCGLGMLDESEIDSIPDAYTLPEGQPYVPTRERDVADRDVVRDAADAVWRRWLELVEQAQQLRLEPLPPVLSFPVERTLLLQEGKQLSERIRQAGGVTTRRGSAAPEDFPTPPGAVPQRAEAQAIADRAHAAVAQQQRSVDQIEHSRQQREEGVKKDAAQN